ncbi:MAG TPA: TadE/TadG family type IV pilus assembly protein [Terriglobia bacterium]|nr:TadE/TadG family type IV pilus assembly protein [Terriglobia bacterium]
MRPPEEKRRAKTQLEHTCVESWFAMICFRASQLLLPAIRRIRAAEGSELVEFSLSLPLLLVIIIGIVDFARAYNTKHITENAARMAARTMVSTPLSVYDPNCSWNKTSPGSGTPCPIQGVAISVANYLTNAGLSAGACLATATASYTSPFTWTYSCNNVTLVIDKAYTITGANGASLSATKISLSYPYTFMFGRIIGLLVPGATGPLGTVILTTNAVMENLVLN